jgi:hypothetical protein
VWFSRVRPGAAAQPTTKQSRRTREHSDVGFAAANFEVRRLRRQVEFERQLAVNALSEYRVTLC